MPAMQRRQLLKAASALSLSAYLSTLRTVWAAGQGIAQPGIQRVSGDVRINDKPAEPGMHVQPGDHISTGPKSQAIYVIGPDAYLQRDNSLVSFSRDKLKDGLRILSGKLLSVYGKGDKRLETSTATIGIRGTGCYIESEAEQVYFCLCYGVADLSFLKTPSQSTRIVTTYHDNPVFLHADTRQIRAPEDLVNHTDSELTLLEALVGRTPPFAGSYGTSKYRSKNPYTASSTD